MASATGREERHVDGGKPPSWLSKVFALNPAAINWPRAVVVLDVLLVPLVVFWAIGHEQYLLSAIFGVAFAALADPGGSFGHRAWHTGIFALIGGGLTALGFGMGGDAWGWLVLAASAVTLVAGLAVMFGVHRFVAAYLLNVWFLITLAVAANQNAHITSHTWAQVLSWAGGCALWIVVTFAAIRWHRVTPTAFELARTELAYGERLRRNRQRIKARTHLRSALAVFERLGAEPWTHRARQELTASGESARRGDRALANELTPHEVQIAILVASGSSNKDTASRLFVSPRTIDAHLGHIYRKLDIHSREDLAAALGAHGITRSF